MGDFRNLSSARTRIMGIVNVNDDSFSGDGSLNLDTISNTVISQLSDGADIIDLGAESARTNREAISEKEEIARLLPVLELWPKLIQAATAVDQNQQWPPLLSINTWRPKVIKELIDSKYGGHIDLINDMSALKYPEVIKEIRHTDIALLIMHSVGLPKEDHSDQRWEDIMLELHNFFQQSLGRASDIPKDQIILDPGLDFAKTPEDGFEIIKRVSEFNQYDCWVLLPLSRKDFIGVATDEVVPQNRDAGTVACLPFIKPLKRCIIRVHNVKAAHQAISVLKNLL